MMELLFNMTIGGTATAGIILLLKWAMKNKLSPKWHYYIWILLAIRLLIPGMPESDISILNNVPTANNLTRVESQEGNIENALEGYLVGEVALKTPISGTVRQHPFQLDRQSVNWIVLVWIMGMAILSVHLISVYSVFNRKTNLFPLCRDEETLGLLETCERLLKVKRKVLVRTGGSTPMLKGLFKPTIIIPEGYSNQELKHIILHELCHYKNKDIWVNIICCVFLCLYWFNPIIWLSFYVIRRDIELLCDQRVIDITGERKEYAHVLLKAALQKNKFVFATTSMQNGEKEVTKRIKHIAYFKKPKVWISVLAVILAVAVGVVCLTDATTKGKPYLEGYQPEIKYNGDWPSTGNKLLEDYFQNELNADMDEATGISDYHITKLEEYVDEEASWQVIYPNSIVFKVDYVMDIANPEKYTFAGGGFEIGPDNKTKVYKNELAVFQLNEQTKKAKFLGFVLAPNRAEMGNDSRAITHLINCNNIQERGKALLDNKTEYIGNNSKVAGIIYNLPFNTYFAGMELQTREEPYGLTVNYDVTSLGFGVFDNGQEREPTDSRGWDLNDALKRQLYENSCMLLSLIDNAGYVSYNITGLLESGEPYSLTYEKYLDREALNEKFINDARNSTETLEKYCEFLSVLGDIQDNEKGVRLW